MATAIRNSLDEIVNLDISISTPASSDETFDCMLFVVEAPSGEGDEDIGTDVISIAKTSDLTDYGFESTDQAYIMADIAFSQSPSPDLIYVTVRQSDSSTDSGYEDISDTLDRADTYGGWYGIALSKTFYDEDTLEAVISWTESNYKLFGFTFVDDELPVTNTNYYRTFAIYGGGVPDYDETPDENYYINVALMAKCFGYDPGAETWAHKVLAVINPCKLTTTMKTYCNDNGIMFFTTYNSRNVTSQKSMVLAGEWIDTIRFRDWLKNDIQSGVFDLFVLNPKIAFTDDGITAIQGKIEESLKAGQTVGGIAPTEYDSDGEATPGYTITVPLSADISDTEKASRTLTGVSFTAILAGAIHAVDISGNLTS